LFKYKILKYSIIIFFSIILLLLLRIIYKPLDISFLNSDNINLKDYIGKFENINTEKVLLDLDLLKNRVTIELGSTKLKKYNNNFSNINARNISATIKISDLIKKSIIIESISISDGNIDIENTTIDTGNTKHFSDFLKGIPVKHINLKNINLNLYKEESRIAVANNINGIIQKNPENIILDSISVDYIEYLDTRNKNKFIINNILVSNKYTDNYIIAIDSLNLINKKRLINIKYLKNIKNITLKAIIANYNMDNKKLSIEGDILVKEKISKVYINGLYDENNITDALVRINFINFPIISLIEDETIRNTKLSLHDAINSSFKGSLILSIDNNKLSNINLDIATVKDKSQSPTTINIKNGDDLNITQVRLKANYKKNKIKINKFIVNSLEGNISLKGNIIEKSAKFEHNFNIELKDFKYSSLVNIAEALYPNINQYQNYTSIIKESFINSLVINLDSREKDTKITFIEASLKNTDLKLKKNVKLAVPEIILKLNNNKNIIINAKSSKLIKNNVFVNLTNIRIILDKYNGLDNIKNNFKITTNISTKYNSFYRLISELNLEVFKNSYVKSIDGDIEGFLNIRKVKNLEEKNKLLYSFSAKLKNFNLKEEKVDAKKFINFNNFNGKLLLDNNGAKVNGKTYINGSMSNVIVLIDNLNTMTVIIDSDAKASSFSFLKEFNYLKSGTNKLNIVIKKSIKSKNWTADIKSDLFASDIEFNFIDYKKLANTRGNLSAKFYFSGNKITKISNLNFFTDNIILKGSLYFDADTNIKKIHIGEYIHGKNNFSTTITYSKDDNRIIKVDGASIDLAGFMKSKNKKNNNLIFYLNTEKLFYENQFVGKVALNAQFKNSLLNNIEGKLFNNSMPYVHFRDIVYKNNQFKKILFEFDDLGLFLQEIKLSDSFIKGKGEILLIIDKKNLSINSGNIDISNSSIKNASFLARLLQLASFTGLLEILTNEGIPFNKIIGDFTVDEKVVNISSLKLKGFSLGGTVKGNINLNNEKINLDGVIIPAYAINSLINKIPLVGQIITGIEGEGLIGVNYNASGTIDKPLYNINPLSILTPGIIRNIIDVFKVEESKPIK